MGKATDGTEIGKQSVTTAHAATGSGARFNPITDARGPQGGKFNFSLSGIFVGTIIVEKTFDNGATWVQAADMFGNNISLTAPGAKVLIEHEKGVGYRTRCSAYTSGTANARLSQ